MTSGREGERGASSIEYALLAAGIAAAVVLAVVLLGGRVTDLFQHTCDKVSTAMNDTCG